LRIKRIYIKDFGIFREEKIEELNKNIVVIGGHNRAGKTTFSRLFRHLGFGFVHKDRSIPEANVDYGVSYDIETIEGEVFNVNIEGKKLPEVKGINTDKSISIEELFGNIDYFTYKQLFTITLDELQNTSTDNPEEIDNMQSILLGAGFKQIIQIPKILKDLERDSKKLGGKNGNPSTAQFKPYYTEIKEGLRLRDKAKLQVDEYYDKKNALNDVEKKIFDSKKELVQVNKDIRFLNLLKTNFNQYENLRALDYKLNKVDFNISLEESKELIYKLLSFKEKIISTKEDISGIDEKIKNYNEIKDNCFKLKSLISSKILDINEEWKDDFNAILKVNTDALEFYKLSEIVEGYKELIYKRKELESEITGIKSNKEIMSKTAPKRELLDLNKLISKYFYIALCVAILGIGLAFIDYRIGLGITISSSIFSGTFIIIKYSSSKKYWANQDIYSKLEELSRAFNEKSEELDEIEKNISERNIKIQNYKDMLSIKEDISGEMLKDYFIQIRDIKKDIINLQELINKATIIKDEIEEKLYFIVSLIEEFCELEEDSNLSSIKENIIKNSRSIFLKFKRLINHLEHAEGLRSLEIERDIIEKSLKGMFKIIDSKDKRIDFREYFEKYTTFEELEKEYLQSEKIRVSIEEDVGKLIKSKHLFELELKKLLSTKDIEVAQRKIYSAKKEFLPIAKKYASLKGAEFILKKVQEGFIEKTKDSLLKGASKYLEEITKGEYINILPGEELGSLDFKAILKDGSVKKNTNILSRATREQLFLSVRLSRIKEIYPSLPIILDDSFVNFDENHTKEVVKILEYLSNTNQIFITTCHSRLVNYIGSVSDRVEYIKLEEGKFISSSKKELSSYLD